MAGQKRMIPIGKPTIVGTEAKAVEKVLKSGWLTMGPQVKKFEKAFAKYTGAKYAVAVSSGTTALHIALMAVGVRPGDVVITVSYSFIATANAIRYCGAEPLFVDINPKTYTMDTWYLKEAVKEKRVTAILPVHQVGMPCNMEYILEIAEENNLPVIEDAACAAGSEVRVKGEWGKIGKPHGDIAIFSFHPRKVITTGDGGMLTTNDEEYAEAFRLLRCHGMSVSAYDRHTVDKNKTEEYTVLGYNYRMTDIQAAIGTEQLKILDAIVEERRKLACLYGVLFDDIDWVETPYEPPYARTNWQSYSVRILPDAPMTRNELRIYLRENGVDSKPAVMTAHQEPVYRDFITTAPIYSLLDSEQARENVILLPLFEAMSEHDIKKIVRLFECL